MTESRKPLPPDWDDDDLPEWTPEQWDSAAIWHGDKLIRPSSGTLTKPGRPRLEHPKRQVTLRLDADVVEKFRASGKGWQSRINAELRKILGL